MIPNPSRAEPLHFPNPDLDAKPPLINRTLLLDLGDWVPYQKGAPVKFNVMDRDRRGAKTLVIQRGDEGEVERGRSTLTEKSSVPLRLIKSTEL